MGTVALKILPMPPTPDGYYYYDQITFGSGTPPPRPHPEPPLGIWGPSDPRPTNPIWGFDPIHGTWPDHPHPPQPPQPPVFNAAVIPLPPSDPPTTPPEGMPPASKQVLIWFGPGTLPTVAWVQPYASTGPVTPPDTATPQA